MNEISITIALDPRLICAVILALVMFGAYFNSLVGRMGEHKQGFTALLVVLGTGVTLLGVGLISWQAAVIAAIGLASSGAPMVIGDVLRYVSMRSRSIKTIQDETCNER